MFKITIKGKEWIIYFRSSKYFTKTHGDEIIAMCVASSRHIDFRNDHYTPTIIRHELTHAFIYETCTHDSNLDTSQMEELFCRLIGDHYTDIGQLTDKILEYRLKK